MAEINNLKLRYTSLYELRKISIESRKSLDEIRENVLIEKKGNRQKALDNSILNIALDICLRTIERVKKEVDSLLRIYGDRINVIK